jgi:hypothetical protein
MSTILEVKSRKLEEISLRDHATMPVKKLAIKNIISDTQELVIIDPINPKRISKESTNSLTKSSLVKAGLVFLGTVGGYYLVKTTGIFSYFGWGAKNSKDVGNSEIMKLKKTASALNVRTNLEIAKQTNSPSVNRITQTYKGEGNTVKFEEIKVEEFEDLLEAKKENVGMRRFLARRSINVKNPIPDQNVIVENFFELTIDGNNVFSSNDSVFLEATNIPTWLNFLPLNSNPTFKSFCCDMPSFAQSQDIAISGNYAYMLHRWEGLKIIDISDPSNPTFKSSCDMPGGTFKVTLSGNYAYVASGSSGLKIIDISNPSNPTLKGSYNTPSFAGWVAISGDYAYVANGDSGLLIIDITDPANPTFKSSYDTPGNAWDIAVSGNYAYVTTRRSGLQILDVSDPSKPTFKSSYDTAPYVAYGVAISGDYAYAATRGAGLQIIDISDPSNPTFKGSYGTSVYALGVALSGNYAYVATGTGGLWILDISDPSNSTLETYYWTENLYAAQVVVSGNYAYVNSGVLYIIALNPSKLILSGIPSSVGTYSVDIKACNEIMECVTDSFDIIVDIDDTTDTIDDTIYDTTIDDTVDTTGITDTTNIIDTTDLTATLIISSMTVAVCIACIASFCFPLIIGGGIVMLRRNRNKILGGESKTIAIEQKEEEEQKALVSKEDIELDVITNSTEKEIPKVASAISTDE